MNLKGALLALAVLVGCAPQQAGLTIDGIKQTLAGQDLGDQPILAVELPELMVGATLQLIGNNGSVQTWRTADNITLSFERGFLIESRGLIDDLLTSDVSSVASGVFAGIDAGSFYGRINEYIGGEDQVVKVVFQCTQTGRRNETIQTLSANRSVTRVSEECRSTTRSINNTYWIGSDGTMWKSVQWVSPLVGYLQTERLVR